MAKQRSISDWDAIVQKFRPIVELADEGKFVDECLPSTVDWYLARSTLKMRDDDSFHIKHPTGDDMLQHNSMSAYLEPESGALGGHQSDAVSYAHVSTKKEGYVDIEYWFFYPLNGVLCTGNNPDFAMWGYHEGDWEHVIVRIDENAKRICGVYFAAHGSDEGGWVWKSTTDEADDDHFLLRHGRPVVYSAWHSHASYARRGYHYRAATKYASNDVALGGNEWDPKAEIIAIDSAFLPHGVVCPQPSWLTWKGRWGSSLDSGTYTTEKSPDGPYDQASWGPANDAGIWTATVGLTVAPAGAKPTGLTSMLAPTGGLTLLFFADAQVQWLQQTGIAWTGPVGIGSGEARSSQLLMARTADEGVLAFCVGGDGQIRCAPMDNEGGQLKWGDWTVLPQGPWHGLSAGLDEAGALHVLAVSSQGLYDMVRIADKDGKRWLAPRRLSRDGHTAYSAIARKSQDGKLVAVVQDNEYFWIMTYDTAGGDWGMNASTKVPTGHSPIVFAQNSDGRYELFAISHDKKLYHCGQKDPDKEEDWRGWTVLGDVGDVMQVAVEPEANGLLALFVRSAHGQIHRTRQKAGGGWQRMSTVTQGTSWMSLARNDDGRLEAFFLQGSQVMHCWEKAPLV